MQDVFEAVGAHAAGRSMTPSCWQLVRGLPRIGACGGQFTANTMPSIMNGLGFRRRA